MEKFEKNHPRFCSQYVKKIGVAKQQRMGWCTLLNLDGKNYIYQGLTKQYKPGDIVFIAKRIALPGKQWTIHQVRLGECFWHYEMFMKKSPKEQRKTPYIAQAQGWWANNTYIVELASIEYIKRQFSY